MLPSQHSRLSTPSRDVQPPWHVLPQPTHHQSVSPNTCSGQTMSQTVLGPFNSIVPGTSLGHIIWKPGLIGPEPQSSALIPQQHILFIWQLQPERSQEPIDIWTTPSFSQSFTKDPTMTKVRMWIAPEPQQKLKPVKIEVQIPYIDTVPVGPIITPSTQPSHQQYLEYLRMKCSYDLAANAPVTNGTKKCKHPQCLTCGMIKESASFTSHVTGNKYIFAGEANCKTKNIIYLIECERCHKQYVGKTTRQLNVRMGEHRTDPTLGISSHRCCPQYTFSDLKVMVIEAHEYPPRQELHLQDEIIRHSLDVAERKWIMELRTLYPYDMNIAVQR